MKEKIQIREARQEDLQKILNLLHQLSPFSEEDKKADIEILKQTLQKIIQDENHYLCIFEYDDKLVGTGTLLIQMNLSHGGKSYGHIENIVVDEEHRKKGIGKKIINHLIEKTKEKSCYKVLLNCKKHNVHFYAKSGMQETGEVEIRLDFSTRN